jgi:hypothetical protein
MLFSSIVFISVFLPILLVSYFLIRKEFRNILLLSARSASLFFYARGEPHLQWVIIVLNYFNSFYYHKSGILSLF